MVAPRPYLRLLRARVDSQHKKTPPGCAHDFSDQNVRTSRLAFSVFALPTLVSLYLSYLIKCPIRPQPFHVHIPYWSESSESFPQTIKKTKNNRMTWEKKADVIIHGQIEVFKITEK